MEDCFIHSQGYGSIYQHKTPRLLFAGFQMKQASPECSLSPGEGVVLLPSIHSPLSQPLQRLGLWLPISCHWSPSLLFLQKNSPYWMVEHPLPKLLVLGYLLLLKKVLKTKRINIQISYTICNLP